MDKKSKVPIPPGLAYLADNISSKHSLLGSSKGAGAKWAQGLDLAKKSEVIFFAGCGYQYSTELEALMSLIRRMDKSAIGAELPMTLAGFQQKIGLDITGVFRKVIVRGGESDGEPLRAAVKVLRNLGIEIGYLADDEPCCGGLLYFVGLQSEFSENAQDVYRKLKSAGVKRIISMVPSCTYTLRSLIPKSVDGYDLEVKHFMEVVQDGIKSRKLQFPGEVRVTYHDPCQLTRSLKLIEEPRSILRSIKGIELLETESTSGEWATCCGGGGGFEAVFPELSEVLAVNRVKELLETGAKIIITHCPGCIMQLKDGLKQLKVSDVEVLDLAQVVAMAMGV